MTLKAKQRKMLPAETSKVRILGMDKNKSKEKQNKCSEELVRITSEDGELVVSLRDSGKDLNRDKERALELYEIIGDVLRKSEEIIFVGDDILIVPQTILTYRARALLFMYAQTYFLIVQAATNTFIGWVDLELNNYYQMIVDDIKELLASDECKDFPGEFKPFSESIFPETGILKSGWRVFAPDCADFLSKAQKYFNDTSEPAKNVIDFEYISQKFSVIKDKAREYARKTKRLCDEYNNKETIPPKESIIDERKKSTQWKPPKGYIGSKTIVANYGIPRTTLQGWAERTEAKVKKDEQTGENYYQKTWLDKQLKKYKPRPKA